MKNKLIDLNNHLFAQLEKLSDDDLGEDDVRLEIARAGALCNIANAIIGNGNLALKAQEMYQKHGKVPEILRLTRDDG